MLNGCCLIILFLLVTIPFTSKAQQSMGNDPYKETPFESQESSLILRSGSIFSFLVLGFDPESRDKNMSPGYTAWMLRGKLVKIYKGRAIQKSDTVFSTKVYSYAGPIDDRPEGLWVDIENPNPRSSEIWVAFCKENTLIEPDRLLQGYGTGCFAVERLERVRKDLEHANEVSEKR